MTPAWRRCIWAPSCPPASWPRWSTSSGYALALSSVYPGAAAALEGLRELDRLLAPGVPVWLGGTNARYLGEELGLARISVVNDARQLDRLAVRPKHPARTPRRTPAVPGPPPPRRLE